VQVVSDMTQDGPTMQVRIGPSQLLSQVNPHTPSSFLTLAMLDTGASHTVVSSSIVHSLGLNPTGQGTVQTPSTTSPFPVYFFDVSLVFPGNIVLKTWRVVEAPLQGQAIECLIGRDILERAILTYIGPANQFTLSF
jgi:hypothetical protein